MMDALKKLLGFKVSTRENDGYPFPDYKSSAPGQVIRADLNLRNSGILPNKADIKMHLRSPSGREVVVPQTREAFNPHSQSYYGLEAQIPQDAELGKWETWANINGQEVPNTRRPHQIIQAQPINRYSGTRPPSPTLNYNTSFGPQSALRVLLNRAGGF